MYLFNKNALSVIGVQQIFDLKELLKSAGWTVTKSGDGASLYSSTGDILTSPLGSAAGFGNARAWFVIRQPGPVATKQRELCYQSQGYGGGVGYSAFRLKYSMNATFSGGSPSATVVPSATDEFVLAGSGTDASPTFGSQLFPDAWGTNKRSQLIANNAPPYDFAGFSYPVGGGTMAQIYMMDGLVPGTYDPADLDPYVFYQASSNVLSTIFSDPGWNEQGPLCQYLVGLPGYSWQKVCALVYHDNQSQAVPGNMGTNPYAGKDEVYPILYGRRAASGAPSGLKGQSTMLRWCGNARNCGDTLSLLTTRDFICAKGDNSARTVALPWDGSTPLV